MRQRSTRREFLTQLAGASAVALTPNVWKPRSHERDVLRAPRLVQTVLGPIDPSKLGFTLPHEHIFAGSAGVLETWPALVGGRTAFRDRVVDKLKAMKAQGVDTIVDVTPSDIGRDVPFLEDVSLMPLAASARSKLSSRSASPTRRSGRSPSTILADSSVARELERVPVRRDGQRRCVHIYASAIAAIDTLRPGMRTGSFAP